MKHVLILLSAILLLPACKKNTASQQNTNPQVEANWSSSAQWGTWTNGGYTLYNNIWGSGAGAQTIWANTYSNWGVWANHPNTGGIKSYPNSTRYVGVALGSLNTLSSSVSATTPSGGAWTSCYDVWDSNNANEIMLWLNWTGAVAPISYTYNSAGTPTPVATNVTVGGATWNIYRGNNSVNNVYSFLRTTKTNNTTIDIKAIMNWIRNQGWFGNVTVGNVQYGYEITSSSGGLDFVCNSYSVSFN
ncbi:Glycosyl hydrolase family 12 [Filimonas lacunae]|uniref:Glycosyl hydrolase family 12 n=1 Tax=Filimonas lacunae TaxID=477680 RepID=A0A173MGH0_9BACT|nr:glycosyl hydrolase [Filimonas lacunae]BAV06580.1 secreted sugar hydrolase [Filimonas lacunae]SIT27463.1 Glycosyl hydrolase family 12 [Filimonas lacunae]